MNMSQLFIKFGMLIKIIYQVSNWYVPILHYYGLRDKQDVIVFRNGTRCIMRNKSDAIAFFEIFFLESNTKMKDFSIKENDTIIDIGAHVGFFTIYAAKRASKGKVFSFEPSRGSFEFLKRNIELNKLENVLAENIGILKTGGIAILFNEENNAIGNSMFKNNVSAQKETVTTNSLNEILNRYEIEKVDLLKMDCEGAEYEIILNLQQETLGKIVKLSAEVHKNIENYKMEDLVKFLTENNFEVECKYLLSDSTENLPMLYARNKLYLDN